MSVNISSAWTKESRPRNGLSAIEGKLVDDELLDAAYWGVVRIEPNFYKVSSDDGSKTPTARIAHVEVALDEADIEAVRTLLQRRFKDRTGIDDAPPATLFDVVPGEGGQDPDGEREVREADADEILAERAERKAAEAEAERAGGVAPPTFSGGTDDAA